MFIIWGWGRKTIKNFGEIFSEKCTNCAQERPWHLLSVSLWFTLFFIPVFAYDTKRFAICPVCGNSKLLNEEQFKALKEYAEINAKYKSGEINAEEFKQRTSDLNSKI